MKLREIVLALAATVVLSSSAHASNNMMQGGAYVGLAGGWGKIDYDTDTAAYFYPSYGAQIESSGFAGRLYVGYLLPLTAASSWAMGPEVSYSSYPRNVYTENNNYYNSITKETAQGLDLLLNVTYAITHNLAVAVKPGIQYAYQKDVTSDFATGQPSALPPSAKTSKILPEINVELDWQVLPSTPLFLGASYQQVFGDSAIGTFERLSTQGNSYASVTSRDMLAVNVEYMFN